MLNRQEIMDIIPHRAPFLLIDEMQEIEPGVKGVARWHITGDEFFFKGHFPHYPVTPGVLIVEALAQTGAVVVLSLPEYKGKIGMLAGLDGFRFKKPVLPGDVLTLTVEIEKIRMSMGVGYAVAAVNGQKAAAGRISFAILDPAADNKGGV